MTGIKPSPHGIVVEDLESGLRYAVSDRNYSVKRHRKVRNLRPGESVLSYRPRVAESLAELASGSGSPDAAGTQAGDASSVPQDEQTEGSAPAGTKGTN